MKINKLFVLLSIFAISFLTAQNDASNDIEGITIEDFEVDSYNGISTAYKSAYGSPYLDENLSVGTILKGKDLVQAYLRYNVFYNEIEIADNPNSKDLSSLIKNKDIKAIINGKTFTYSLRNIDGQIRGSFYEIVATGSKFDLYKQNSVRFIAPRAATTSLQSDRPGKFIQSYEYYLVSKEGEFIPIPEKRKKLFKSLDTDTEEFKAFFKENKIDLCEDEDVTKFVSFYNSL